MNVHLQRLVSTPHGVFGRLTVIERAAPSQWFCVENADTLIAPGVYPITHGYYDKGAYVAYEIIVPGRDELLVHAANLASQLRGCVAPGLELGFFDGKLAVLRSRTALAQFMAAMAATVGEIEIVGP